jgi:hypothetical protein
MTPMEVEEVAHPNRLRWAARQDQSVPAHIRKLLEAAADAIEAARKGAREEAAKVADLQADCGGIASDAASEATARFIAKAIREIP